MRLLSRVLGWVEGLPHLLVLLLCLALVAGVGALDYVTADIVLSIFYAVPVSLAAWTLGRREGLLLALLATMLWTVADHDGLHQSWASAPPWWNAMVRLSFFALVVFILTALKEALAKEQRLARVDPLTGVANVRQFTEQTEFELNRSTRSGEPLSVAVLDVDDLKSVNDTYGHAAGDAVLAGVAQALKSALRTTDLVARIGGDEFAVLLPDTDAAAASVAFEKGRTAAASVAHTAQAVTLSVGVVNCPAGQGDVEMLLRQADALMYEVKSAGKNGVRVAACESAPGGAVRSSVSETGRIVSA